MSSGSRLGLEKQSIALTMRRTLPGMVEATQLGHAGLAILVRARQEQRRNLQQTAAEARAIGPAATSLGVVSRTFLVCIVEFVYRVQIGSIEPIKAVCSV